MIDGLLQLYEATFESRWFNEARRLADWALAHFRAPDGGFYDTSDDHESLIIRPRNVQDNATPSGSAMFATDLLRLAAYTGETQYEEAALSVYRSVGGALSEYPMAFGQMLIGLDLYIRRPVEIALIGDPADERMEAMLNVVRKKYRPTAVVALSVKNPDPLVTPALLRTRTLRDGGQRLMCARTLSAPPR